MVAAGWGRRGAGEVREGGGEEGTRGRRESKGEEGELVPAGGLSSLGVGRD